jgi:hypothetical protein
MHPYTDNVKVHMHPYTDNVKVHMHPYTDNVKHNLEQQLILLFYGILTFFPNTHTHGKLSTLTMVTVLLTPSFAKHEDAQFSMMGFKALSLQFDLRVKIPYEGIHFTMIGFKIL